MGAGQQELAEQQAEKEALSKKRTEERARLAAEQQAEKEAEDAKNASMLAWDDTVAKSRASAMADKTVVFKSLYIGMPIEDALRVLFKRMHDLGRSNLVYPDTLSAIEGVRSLEANNLSNGVLVNDFARVVQENAESPVVIISSFSITTGTVLHGFVAADSSGSVIKICMDTALVNALFDSADMEAANFVETFKSAYGVPLKMENVWPQEWSHTTASGAKLTIDHRKTLRLEKVATETERKASFD
jgi:hypothetical protein